MTAPTKLTGSNGIVSVNGISIVVADFSMSIKRGVAAQPRVGKYSDRKKAGKVELTGSFTNVDIIGDHLARLMTSGANVAAETKTVINACNDYTAWTSSDVPNTPIANEGTIIKEGTYSLKITCGANSNNDTIYITALAAKDLTGHQVIDFWIRAPVTGAIIKVGFGETAITDNEHTITIQAANTWQHEYWDISAIAAASKNAVDNFGFTILSAAIGGSIYIDDINAHLGVRLGVGSEFTIYGDAIDSSSNRVKVTAANAFITGGTLKIGDTDSFIDGPIEFTCADADVDLTLTYT